MPEKPLVFPFEIKSQKITNKYFEFEGYLSTFGNVDRGRDVVMPGAFEKTLQEIKARAQDNGKAGLLPLLWQHNMREPVGTFIEMREDDKGLFVKARMPLSDTFVTGRVIPQMEIGSIDRMSIGYTIVDAEYEEDVRRLKELNLWEGSLVTIAENDNATIEMAQIKAATSFKDLPLASRTRSWDSDAAVARIRKFTDSSDEPSRRYRNAFMWYDSASAEKFGSYKLPYADVIDGQLKAVPRAIFAIAGVLQGARGGVDIPSADRASIVRHVERYYSKMDLESPFKEKSSFRIDDIEALSVRTLENLLQSGVHCTRKSSKILAGLIKASLDRDGQDSESKRDASAELSSEDFDKVLELFDK